MLKIFRVENSSRSVFCIESSLRFSDEKKLSILDANANFILWLLYLCSDLDYLRFDFIETTIVNHNVWLWLFIVIFMKNRFHNVNLNQFHEALLILCLGDNKQNSNETSDPCSIHTSVIAFDRPL